jgi:hypothetical protein
VRVSEIDFTPGGGQKATGLGRAIVVRIRAEIPRALDADQRLQLADLEDDIRR